MTIQIIGIIFLIAIFALAIWKHFDVGVMMFLGAYLLGVYFGKLKFTEVVAGLPSSIIIIMLGVFVLVAISQYTKAMELLVSKLIKLTGGRLWLLIWMFYLANALLMFASIPGVFVLAPIGISLIKNTKIHPMLVVLSMIFGMLSTSFSPIVTYGVMAEGAMKTAGIPFNSATLVVGNFISITVLYLIAFFFLGGRQLFSQGSISLEELNIKADGKFSKVHIANLLAIIVLVMMVLLKIDLAFSLFAVSFVLLLFFFKNEERKAIMHSVNINAILLIGGIFTFSNVLTKLEVITYIAKGLTSIGSPILGGLLINYTGYLLSFFSSAGATVGLLLPITAKLIQAGVVNPMGAIIAMGVSSLASALSPFALYGAFSLATYFSPELGVDQDKMRTLQLKIGVIVGLLFPLAMWLVWMVTRF